jgi:hypothetical protein
MDQFENDLKQALQRVEPAAGFEHRVMRRLNAAPKARNWTAWATAAGLAFASFAAVGVYQNQQQRRAEAACDQLVLALRVTGQKLDLVRSRINPVSQKNEAHNR